MCCACVRTGGATKVVVQSSHSASQNEGQPYRILKPLQQKTATTMVSKTGYAPISVGYRKENVDTPLNYHCHAGALDCGIVRPKSLVLKGTQLKTITVSNKNNPKTLRLEAFLDARV